MNIRNAIIPSLICLSLTACNDQKSSPSQPSKAGFAISTTQINLNNGVHNQNNITKNLHENTDHATATINVQYTDVEPVKTSSGTSNDINITKNQDSKCDSGEYAKCVAYTVAYSPVDVNSEPESKNAIFTQTLPDANGNPGTPTTKTATIGAQVTTEDYPLASPGVGVENKIYTNTAEDFAFAAVSHAAANEEFKQSWNNNSPSDAKTLEFLLHTSKTTTDVTPLTNADDNCTPQKIQQHTACKFHFDFSTYHFGQYSDAPGSIVGGLYISNNTNTVTPVLTRNFGVLTNSGIYYAGTVDSSSSDQLNNLNVASGFSIPDTEKVKNFSIKRNTESESTSTGINFSNDDEYSVVTTQADATTEHKINVKTYNKSGASNIAISDFIQDDDKILTQELPNSYGQSNSVETLYLNAQDLANNNDKDTIYIRTKANGEYATVAYKASAQDTDSANILGYITSPLTKYATKMQVSYDQNNMPKIFLEIYSTTEGINNTYQCYGSYGHDNQSSNSEGKYDFQCRANPYRQTSWANINYHQYDSSSNSGEQMDQPLMIGTGASGLTINSFTLNGDSPTTGSKDKIYTDAKITTPIKTFLNDEIDHAACTTNSNSADPSDILSTQAIGKNTPACYLGSKDENGKKIKIIKINNFYPLEPNDTPSQFPTSVDEYQLNITDNDYTIKDYKIDGDTGYIMVWLQDSNGDDKLETFSPPHTLSNNGDTDNTQTSFAYQLEKTYTDSDFTGKIKAINIS